INHFVVDINPVFTMKAVYEVEDKIQKEVDITPEDNSLHMKEETVRLTIYLPDSFGEGDRVWVKHKGTVFGGTEGLPVTFVDGKPCVIYDHTGGFSPFEISKTRLYPDPEVKPSPSGSSDNVVKLPKTGIE
ncbi:MAG: hypothetical protein J6Z03_02900, partial [Erysipelotrichaceae bacterium]|nr:hypothetical protein [Erysipelotrichaceae bacterium]